MTEQADIERRDWFRDYGPFHVWRVSDFVQGARVEALLLMFSPLAAAVQISWKPRFRFRLCGPNDSFET